MLVVEAHAPSRRVLADLLAEWGADVRVAAGLLEAREATKGGRRPDGVFLGQTAEGSAEAPAFGNSSVIRVVPLSRSIEAGQPPGGGAVAGLAKPVSRTRLRHCLATLLASPSVVTPAIASSPAPAIRPGRVLLVEDNPVNQKVATVILERWGCRVECATNGYAALAALERSAYDLVLMDVQMPDLDGLEATRRIRSPASRVLNRQIPIIAITAHATEGDREQCLQAGMDEYLSKPFRSPDLIRILTRWLSV
jgi:CheY-like chemotaxis protein